MALPGISPRPSLSFLLVLGLGLVPVAGVENRPDTSLSGADVLSGADILARMVKVYSTCRSYQDTGVVRITYFDGASQRTQERPFKTAFVRPDSFRFEFTDSNPSGTSSRYIVWQRGTDVRKWWGIEPGVQILPSLNRGLAEATGVSGGSAHTIPSLLLPKAALGRSLTEMTKLKRLGDATCGSAVCARIEGVLARQERTLWVELGSFLLRRIDTATVFPTFRTEQTTSYEPTVNQAIPPEVLDFDPPRKD